MRRLAQAGLTTREACGNSVRNITACPYAGVAGDELFDVTPYAEALTRYLLRHPLSSSLPRKFKIAFEGCAEDHALTAINDLGFRAAVNDSAERGFRVTAGGGTAILCTSGRVLHEFLPASELFNLAESILRVFHRLGDREHKQRNRMKFLIKQLGWEQWRETVERAREAFIAESADRRSALQPAIAIRFGGGDLGASSVERDQGSGDSSAGRADARAVCWKVRALERYQCAPSKAARLLDCNRDRAVGRFDLAANARACEAGAVPRGWGRPGHT